MDTAGVGPSYTGDPIALRDAYLRGSPDDSELAALRACSEQLPVVKAAFSTEVWAEGKIYLAEQADTRAPHFFYRVPPKEYEAWRQSDAFKGLDGCPLTLDPGAGRAPFKAWVKVVHEGPESFDLPMAPTLNESLQKWNEGGRAPIRDRVIALGMDFLSAMNETELSPDKCEMLGRQQELFRIYVRELMDVHGQPDPLALEVEQNPFPKGFLNYCLAVNWEDRLKKEGEGETFTSGEFSEPDAYSALKESSKESASALRELSGSEKSASQKITTRWLGRIGAGAFVCFALIAALLVRKRFVR